MNQRPHPSPLPYVRPSQCRFCTSRVCGTHIFTRDGSFDEVACRRHGLALYPYADATIPKGTPRMHSSGTAEYRRGGDCAEGFVKFYRHLGDMDAYRWLDESSGVDVMARFMSASVDDSDLADPHPDDGAAWLEGYQSRLRRRLGGEA